jgi:hypothetical protein
MWKIISIICYTVHGWCVYYSLTDSVVVGVVLDYTLLYILLLLLLLLLLLYNFIHFV